MRSDNPAKLFCTNASVRFPASALWNTAAGSASRIASCRPSTNGSLAPALTKSKNMPLYAWPCSGGPLTFPANCASAAAVPLRDPSGPSGVTDERFRDARSMDTDASRSVMAGVQSVSEAMGLGR